MACSGVSLGFKGSAWASSIVKYLELVFVIVDSMYREYSMYYHHDTLWIYTVENLTCVYFVLCHVGRSGSDNVTLALSSRDRLCIMLSCMYIRRTVY
jgi:Na+-driven multidrug efflux pump